MRAAVGCGVQEVRIEERPVPEPGPGEVRLRTRACGLCGSDLHFYHSGLWVPGQVPGHEITGAVDALGEGVEGWSPGDCAAVEPLHACGGCDACAAGRDAICREGQIYGVQRPGGMADYVTVPARRLFRVPEALEPSVAALAEPMAVVVHGLRRGALEPGQRVLVLGAGSIGLAGLVAGRALGAGEVFVTARYPHQAKLAGELGADRVLGEPEASIEALDALGRETSIDLVLETVGGGADTLNAATAAIRPGGTVSVVGVFWGNVTVNALPLFLKEGSLTWSNCYEHPPADARSADFATAVEIVTTQAAALAPLVTEAVPLDRVQDAFAHASDKSTGAIKISVVP